MSDHLLQHIQELQFKDRSAAEDLLKSFISETIDLDVVGVELRPQAVSLNSFNGFMTAADGRRLFFKTHTEPDSVIGEYYNAKLLADVGYPVIQPLYSSQEDGKQILVYEVVESPSVFDLAWSIEHEGIDMLVSLRQAQHKSDEELLALYRKSLHWQDAPENAQAAVHQLFHHRLVRGRLRRFYGELDAAEGDSVRFPVPGSAVPMSELYHMHWVINGQAYSETLYDLIAHATDLLNPVQEGPAITGHGDAHNGNVFFQQSADSDPSLLYFDPAFAGHHHPLLDLTKPLFHNVFAMWMYFPQEKAKQTTISLRRDGETWHVDHDYTLHPVRHMFLQSKVQHVLVPTLQDLKARGWLRDDWRTFLKAALLCCPLLTVNLADRVKYPPELGLLGLSMAVEMGAESSVKRSLIDTTLDGVAEAIAD